MRSETREILDAIGWQTVVERYPATAMRLAKTLIKRPGGPQAKADLEQILEVELAIKNLRDAMAKLSGRLIDDIDEVAGHEHWLNGDPHLCVWDSYVSCQTLLPALKQNREVSEAIIRNSSAGSISPRTGQVRKPRAPVADDNPYVIAAALAEVYLLGLRSYPKVGTDAETGAINSLFNRTLSALLQSESYPVPTSKTIVSMANAAKRELTLSNVKVVLRKNAATLHRWRSSSCYAIATREVIWRDMQGEEDLLWSFLKHGDGDRLKDLETSG